jgi:hypothetical protein
VKIGESFKPKKGQRRIVPEKKPKIWTKRSTIYQEMF